MGPITKSRQGASKDERAGEAGSPIGSLLTDLLTQAKAELSSERQALDQQLEQKHLAEQQVRDRSEAARREALQAQLIEETRRRSESLARSTRRDRALGAAPAPCPMEPGAVAGLGYRPERAAASGRRSAWVWLVAALMVVAAGGVTAAVALSQPAGMSPPTLAGVSDNAINRAKLELAEHRLDATARAAEATRAKLEDAVKRAALAEGRVADETRLREAAEAAMRASSPVAGAGAGRTKKQPAGKRKPPKTLKIRTHYFR